jgi:hypothetical protein
MLAIGIFQFDFFGDRHTVFGDVGSAEGFLDHHIAAFGAKGYFHSIGQCVNAFFEFSRASVSKVICFAAIFSVLNV